MKRLFSLSVFAGFLLFIVGCTEPPTESVYDPNYQTGVQEPTITGISSNSTASYILGGVHTIYINGTNIETDTSKIHVFFNNTEVQISTISSTQIAILAPNMILDSIRVRVLVDNALKYSNLQYVSIRSAMILVKGIDTSKQVPYAMTFNGAGDLYVQASTRTNAADGIYQVPATGAGERVATNTGYVTTITGLKFRGNLLIACFNNIAFLSPNNATPTPALALNLTNFSTFSISVEDFDFDQNRVIWGGSGKANEGIIRIDSLKKLKKFPFSPGGKIHSVRVYDGSVYCSAEATDGTKGVWKLPINTADTSLGAAVKYFDLSATVGNTTDIAYGITFDTQGNLYVGTDAADGVYVVATDQTSQPLYNGIIGPNCKFLAWGKDSYLYVVKAQSPLNTKPSCLYKIDMLGKLSAPYYGQ